MRGVWSRLYPECNNFHVNGDLTGLLCDPGIVPRCYHVSGESSWLLSVSIVMESTKQPPKKKLKLSLTKKKQFAAPVSEEEFCDTAKEVVLLNTKNNCWAQRTLGAWIEEKNKVNPGSVPTDFLSFNDPVTVCKYLRYFVLEAGSHDGTKYSPATIRSILSGLKRILKESKAPFSIFDK